MNEIDIQKTCKILDNIMKYELAGVVRYTHSSMMVSGPYRIPIVEFLQAQANESLLHAQEAGEIVTGLGGHPSLKIQIIEESNKHSTVDLLNESSEHEKEAVGLYKILLEIVKDESVYIEEYARGMIKAEEMHAIEVTKMLKDYAEA